MAGRAETSQQQQTPEPAVDSRTGASAAKQWGCPSTPADPSRLLRRCNLTTSAGQKLHLVLGAQELRAVNGVACMVGAAACVKAWCWPAGCAAGYRHEVGTGTAGASYASGCSSGCRGVAGRGASAARRAPLAIPTPHTPQCLPHSSSEGCRLLQAAEQSVCTAGLRLLLCLEAAQKPCTLIWSFLHSWFSTRKVLTFLRWSPCSCSTLPDSSSSITVPLQQYSAAACGGKKGGAPRVSKKGALQEMAFECGQGGKLAAGPSAAHTSADLSQAAATLRVLLSWPLPLFPPWRCRCQPPSRPAPRTQALPLAHAPFLSALRIFL